ncbi:hypothetical protein BWI17_10840 [Betaproteobacteria bacterium GR16-43]|nr:hypothetical protein BWI17_10840 [Betaproteobacteria bacterium GR16-43]
MLPLVAALATAALPVHALTYTVTTASPTGPGSLDEKIGLVNTNCLTDPSPVINFSGPFVISPAIPLTTFVCPSGPLNVVVDASSVGVPNTASGSFNGTPGLALDGLGAVTGMCGLSSAITNGSLTVRGLQIMHFNQYGGDAGICGFGLIVEGNVIKANRDGIIATGTNGASIGGTTAAKSNVISGHGSGRGIDLQATGAKVVRGNLIGTDNTGTAADPNNVGIYVYGGGSATIANNLISGNSSQGMVINNPATTTTVSGNKIGVGAANGTGILVQSGANSIDINSNEITNNDVGVDIQGGTGTYLSNNQIYANTSKAVALGVAGGPRPNDAGDGDGGPNNGQNYPTILSVNQTGGNTIVTFSFNSNPSETFFLQFFSNAAPGVYSGQTPIGGLAGVTTDAAGDLSSTNSVTLTGTFNNISAMANRLSTNDVSEFSQAVAFVGVPAATLVPTTMAFGNVGTGSTSATQTSVYSSTGTGTVLLSAIGSTACYGGPVCNGTTQFICSTTCVGGGMYAPGNSCTVTAAFAPSALGPQSTTIQICDLAPGSPRTITLTGTGVAPPAFTLNPVSYNFGSVPVGSTAGTSFTLQNTGAVPIPMGTYSAGSSGFAVQRVSCNNPIQVGEVCRIDVGFTPTSTGTFSDALVVTPSVGPGASSGLTGIGTVAPQILLPGLIELVYVVGAPNPAVSNLTIKNTGTAPATIDGLVIAGPGYTLEHNCPATLAVGESCVAKISFSSAAPGDFSGSLTVMTNAPGGSRAIQLLAHASLRPVPLLQVTPREIGYGARAFGTTSPTSPVILKNIGGADVRFDSIVVSPDFVIISKSCGDVLPSLASCELQVAMRATSYGQRFGFVTINSNAEASPHRASVFGTSCRIGGFVSPRQGLGTGC